MTLRDHTTPGTFAIADCKIVAHHEAAPQIASPSHHFSVPPFACAQFDSSVRTTLVGFPVSPQTSLSLEEEPDMARLLAETTWGCNAYRLKSTLSLVGVAL